MKFLKFVAVLVAVAGVAALALVYAPVMSGQRPDGRDFMMLRGPGSAIGASIRDVEPSDKNAGGGVVVEDVRAGSPAEKAGLKRGDVIVEFDGERVRSARQFTRLVGETPASRTVKATVVRDGRRTDLQVTPTDRMAGAFDGERLRERFGDFEGLADRIPFDFNFELPSSRGRLGVTVQELTPQLDTYFAAKGGVLVTSVTETSPADKAGVKAGDVITAVNGTSIHSRADLTRALRDADGDATLTVVRDRKEMTLKAKIEGRPRTSRSARPM